METLLFEGELKLLRYQGNGGWTHLDVPFDPHRFQSGNGWLALSVNIDGRQLALKGWRSKGEKPIFLVINKEIQKQIGKAPGDTVSVTIYAQARQELDADQIIACLHDAPRAFSRFQSLAPSEQRLHINYVLEASSDQAATERIIALIRQLDL
jgi:Domain of unknown function (DUF1905)